MSIVDDWDDDNNTPFVANKNSGKVADDSLQGYVKAPTQVVQKEPEIFSVAKVDYKPTDAIKHLVVASNIIVIAFNNGHIVRINLAQTEEIEDIEISKKEQIHKLFLDPTGTHLIISMENEENFYIHSRWKKPVKPKALSKMKGVLVESVAWDKTNEPNSLSTKDILIGTNKGKIFETVIEANDKAIVERIVVGVTGNKDHLSFKPLYYVGENVSITGLRYDRFITSGSDPTKYYIVATTPTRIYQFIGGPSFEECFQNYETNPSFTELPGDITRSELQFFSKYSQGLPKSFAWLTGPGIFYGELVFGSQNPGDSVISESSLLTYPRTTNTDNNSNRNQNMIPPSTNPLALVITEFHFLLLYEDKLQAVSSLSKSIAWEEYFSKSVSIRLGRDRVMGLASDSINKTIWLYSQFGVYEVVVNNEDRNVWEMYLEKGQYEDALKYCKNPAQKDKVWTSQADHYFKINNFKLAAEYYGKSQKSFEEVTLKFINLNEIDALKNYLFHKLSSIKHSQNQTQTKNNNFNRDATQITMISTWLTELYLDKLNQFSDISTPNSKRSAQTNNDMYSALVEEFEQFLNEFKDNLDKNTTFKLISSHGRLDLLLYFATIIEDYERVVSHHIQNGKFLLAIEVMSKQSKEELYYKYSPILMYHIPQQTVNVWISSVNNREHSCSLDPRKLIPSLMRYEYPINNPPEDKSTHQAIRYLQFCVKKLDNKDPAIHNYLLSLYASQNDEKALLEFLAKQPSYYDLKYALRLCTKESKTQACVSIYSSMGLYEEAVELALKVNIDLAITHANKPDDDDNLRKKLWLRIARYVVEVLKDIKQAMDLLTKCELLKIEDILPFFPEFTHIDEFKDEICTSLEDYNRHIHDLIYEMDDATKSADLIRLDIKDLRYKYAYINNNQLCALCDYPLLTREFYVFPCGHGFHSDCLTKDVLKQIDSVRKQRLFDLLSQLQSSGSTPNPSITSSVSGKKKQIASTPVMETNELFSSQNDPMMITSQEKLKDEVDDIVASECIYCGEFMIKSIAEPFVRLDEREAIESWGI